MNEKSLSNLMLRITGVIIIVITVSTIPSDVFVLLTLPNNTPYSPFALWLLEITGKALPIIIGWLLISSPGLITKKLTIDTTPQQTDPAVFQQLQKVLFSVLGLYFVSASITNAVFLLTKYALPTDELLAPSKSLLLTQLSASGTQVVVGFILLIGAGGISNLVERLRDRR